MWRTHENFISNNYFVRKTVLPRINTAVKCLSIKVMILAKMRYRLILRSSICATKQESYADLRYTQYSWYGHRHIFEINVP